MLEVGPFQAIRDARNWVTGVPRYTPKIAVVDGALEGSYWPCDTLSTDIFHMLGLPNFSRVDNEGKLVSYGGREQNAGMIHKWLKKHHKKYGGVDVTMLSVESREKLLAQGLIMYGATKGHTYVLWSMKNPESGKTSPILTQAGDFNCNAMFVSKTEGWTARRNNPRLEANLDLNLYAFTPPEFKLPDNYPTEHYQRQDFIGECGPAVLAMVISEQLGYSAETRGKLMKTLDDALGIVGKDGKPTGRYATAVELKMVIDTFNLGVTGRFIDYNTTPYENLKIGAAKSGGRSMIARVNAEYDAAGKGGFNHFVVVKEVDVAKQEVVVFDPLNLFPDHLVAGMKPYLNGPVRVGMDTMNRAMTDVNGKRGEILILEENG